MNSVVELLRFGTSGLVALLNVALLVIAVAVVRPVSASAAVALSMASLLWLSSSLGSTVFFVLAPALDLGLELTVVRVVTFLSSLLYAVGLGLLLYAIIALANRA